MLSSNQERSRSGLAGAAGRVALFALAVAILVASPSARTLGQGTAAPEGGVRAALDAMAIDLVGGR